MRKRTVITKSLIVPLLAVFPGIIAAAQAPAPAAQPAGIAVVVNVNNSVTNISLADLRKIFSGEKHTWPGGAPVKILVRPSGSREQLALLRLLKMSDTEYKQYWTAQVFRGEADAEPVALPSFGMVKEAIRAFVGAIALVNAQDVRTGMDVKIIKVENHLPGEPGYPIQ
jgi:ABC-type phosphate transport system substrate-binding protein